MTNTVKQDSKASLILLVSVLCSVYLGLYTLKNFLSLAAAGDSKNDSNSDPQFLFTRFDQAPVKPHPC